MSDTARDPLAELARIIGQSNRVNDFDRDPRRNVVETLDEPLRAADRDWPADDDYAEPDAPEQYPDQYAEENYVQPRLPEPYPADHARERYDRDDERAPSIAGQYSEPAETYDDARDDERAHDPRYRDEEPPRRRRQPALAPQTLAPQSHDDEYEAEDQWDDQPDRQSDDAEDYDDEDTARPRRSGLVVVLAMVGLVMIGAGGAFAYRTMFGGAILAPSLPPVIKANDAPNKIVPNRTDAQNAAANPGGATTSGAPDKLVSREEQPVPVQPANAPPRVVSTIPVLPAPGAAPAGAPTPAHPCRRTHARRAWVTRSPGAAVGSAKGRWACSSARSAAGRIRGAEESPHRHHSLGPGRQRQRRGPGACRACAGGAAQGGSARQGNGPQGRRQRAARHRAGRARRSTGTGCGAAAHPRGTDRSAQRPDCHGACGRWLCGAGHLAALRGRGPDRVQIAPGQIPRPARQPPADHPSRRSRRQRHLLPRLGRPLRLLRGGRGHVQQFEGRRRQLHRPEELAAAA